MKPAEIITTRIDRLNEGLNPAVRRSGGAEFALMLSMIAESQALAQRLERSAEIDTAAGWEVRSRDDLYDAPLVGAMNRALANRRLGDLHLAVSWVETVPLKGRRRLSAEPQPGEMPPVEGIPLSQAALLAKRYTLLDEIKESRTRFAA